LDSAIGERHQTSAGGQGMPSRQTRSGHGLRGAPRPWSFSSIPSDARHEPGNQGWLTRDNVVGRHPRRAQDGVTVAGQQMARCLPIQLVAMGPIERGSTRARVFRRPVQNGSSRRWRVTPPTPGSSTSLTRLTGRGRPRIGRIVPLQLVAAGFAEADLCVRTISWIGPQLRPGSKTRGIHR
jgi:hypothetical protein